MPNEHGTWLYGRGGWCDGDAVAPHVFDVTSQLSFVSDNVIVYNATNQGHAPNPQKGVGRAAYIAFEAFLTIW